MKTETENANYIPNVCKYKLSAITMRNFRTEWSKNIYCFINFTSIWDIQKCKSLITYLYKTKNYWTRYKAKPYSMEDIIIKYLKEIYICIQSECKDIMKKDISRKDYEICNDIVKMVL